MKVHFETIPLERCTSVRPLFADLASSACSILLDSACALFATNYYEDFLVDKDMAHCNIKYYFELL